MKNYRVLFLILGITIGNNIALIKLGYLQPSVPGSIGSANRMKVDTSVVNSPSRINALSVDAEDKTKQGSSLQNETEDSSVSKPLISKIDAIIEQKFERLLTSNKFEHALDEHKIEANSRASLLSDRLDSLNSVQLMSIALGSNDAVERKTAQFIVTRRHEEYQNSELKALFNSEGVSELIQHRLLPVLVEAGDVDAIINAKEVVMSGAANRFLVLETIQSLYEVDPDFVLNHLNSLDFNNARISTPAIFFMHKMEDLQKVFYEDNFDQILSITNTQTLRHLYSAKKIDISSAQQSKLAEMLGSSNRIKRTFAIGWVHNIDDLGLLRSSYSELTVERDKRYFLNTLLKSDGKPEHQALAKELLAGEGDAVKQLMGMYYSDPVK